MGWLLAYIGVTTGKFTHPSHRRIDPQRQSCYSEGVGGPRPALLQHLNLPRYRSKDGGNLNHSLQTSAATPRASGR